MPTSYDPPRKQGPDSTGAEYRASADSLQRLAAKEQGDGTLIGQMAGGILQIQSGLQREKGDSADKANKRKTRWY